MAGASFPAGVDVLVEGGYITVTSPYHAAWVEILKGLNGRWDKDAKRWTIPACTGPRLNDQLTMLAQAACAIWPSGQAQAQAGGARFAAAKARYQRGQAAQASAPQAAAGTQPYGVLCLKCANSTSERCGGCGVAPLCGNCQTPYCPNCQMRAVVLQAQAERQASVQGAFSPQAAASEPPTVTIGGSSVAETSTAPDVRAGAAPLAGASLLEQAAALRAAKQQRQGLAR